MNKTKATKASGATALILSSRQETLLNSLKLGQSYNIDSVSEALAKHSKSDLPSAATLRRDLSSLVEYGYIKQVGQLKGTKYSLTFRGLISRPIDEHAYCEADVDTRGGQNSYNFEFFELVQKEELLNSATITELKKYTHDFIAKSNGASAVLKQKELERFTIELSWKSSKIEGNTYSLLDTERLIKDSLEAKEHTREEAIMILNHKKAFDYIIENIALYKQISLKLIEDVHRLLTTDLNVGFGLRSKPVGITGSCYAPLAVRSQIKEAIEELCSAVNSFKDPFSKAFLMLLGISYVQPFEDGNKRTARLMCNALLLAHNCSPLSYRSVSEVGYRESMLVFYETNSILPMSKIFTEQYRFACSNYLKVV